MSVSAGPLSGARRSRRRVATFVDVPTPGRTSGTWWAVRVVAVLFLLGLSWVLGAAPSSSADEDSHYIRMVGLSRGDVVGRDVPIDTPADGYTRHSGRQLQRLNVESGIYHLSPGELPADPCNRFRPAQPFVCAPRTPSATNEIRSYHARTLPMSYVIPALLSRLGTGAASKLVLGRLGFLVQACALLVVAFVACGRWLRRSPWAVGCVLTAMTPLAVYEFGVLAPSGTEFAAVVSFTAALWRALHDDEPRWWWLASALGAVAVLSRDTGLVLTVLSAAVVLSAVPGSVSRVRSIPLRQALAYAAVPLLASGGALWWRGHYQMTLPVTLRALRRGLNVSRVAHLAYDSVGRVGWLDTPLAAPFVVVWVVIGGAMIIRAAAAARPAARAAMLATLLWGVYNVLLSAALVPTGFPNQPRFSLPLLGAGALVVGLAAGRDAAQTGRRWLRVAAAAFGLIQLAMVLTAARRSARGLDGLNLSLRGSLWTPPVGWAVVLAIAALGAIGVGALAWTNRADEPGEPRLPATGAATGRMRPRRVR